MTLTTAERPYASFRQWQEKVESRTTGASTWPSLNTQMTDRPGCSDQPDKSTAGSLGVSSQACYVQQAWLNPAQPDPRQPLHDEGGFERLRSRKARLHCVYFCRRVKPTKSIH
jgi:hypothetical protein